MLTFSSIMRVTALVAIVGVSQITALGQQQIPRYSPQKPTVSPYVNLLRDEFGGVPNYYSLVRPQLDQQATNNRVATASKSQSIAVRRLEEVASGATARPTGSGATFRSYSHYYPRLQGR